MTDPFEEVEPLTPLDEWAVRSTTLQRSMMWDFIGPFKMRDSPEQFGQTPASSDVLEQEYKEMAARYSLLSPFGSQLSLMCYIAAESISQVLLTSDDKYESMSEEEQLQFRMQNVNIGAAITNSVLSHMLQDGLLQQGVST